MHPRTDASRPGALVRLLLLAAAVGSTLSPRLAASERGLPLIQSYVPTVEAAETQSFAVVRDPRGVLYVGNLAGVLVYDGAWWRLVSVGRTRSAFSLASDARGRVAVGGVDALGCRARDAGGTLRYVSLLRLLPAGEREVGQVMQVLP